MNRDYKLTEIIKGIKNKEEAAEKDLYRFFYSLMFKLIKSFESDEQKAREVFQETFYIISSKIKRGKIHLPEQEDQTQKMLTASFRRYAFKRLFDMDRSVASLIKGVEKNIRYAENHLLERLHNQSVKKYAAYLGSQYQMGPSNHEDLLSEALTKLADNIKVRKFSLDENAPNEMNRNKIFKYFRTMLFGMANKKTRNYQKDQKLYAELKETQSLLPDYAAIKYKEQESLSSIASEAFDNLDQVGQYILKEFFYYKKKPRQIAQTCPYPQYRNTAKVVEKKAACLSKLRVDFGGLMNQAGNVSLIQEFKNLSQYVIQQLEEPCLTILKLTIAPIKKTSAEIVEIIQQTLPLEIASNFKSPIQINKRRYRCLQSMHENLWQELYNRQKL